MECFKWFLDIPLQPRQSIVVSLLTGIYLTLCMSRMEGGGFFLLRMSSSWYLGASSSLLILWPVWLYCDYIVTTVCLLWPGDHYCSLLAIGCYYNITPSPCRAYWPNLATVGTSSIPSAHLYNVSNQYCVEKSSFVGFNIIQWTRWCFI